MLGLVGFSLLSLTPAPLQEVASARADEPVFACGITDAAERTTFSSPTKPTVLRRSRAVTP